MIQIGERIYVDSDLGKPMISGTTITVEAIMELASQGIKAKQIRREPGMRALLDADIEAAITFARDSWCTPKFVADVLPKRDRLIDPCSNPRSFVDACIRFMLELGENGLERAWFDDATPHRLLLAYVNAGFSDLLPWADKLRAERDRIAGAALMCNVDNSTKWWKSLTDQCSCVFFFDRRLPFIPFPGTAKSTNNKPQAMIGDRAFFEECKPALFEARRDVREGVAVLGSEGGMKPHPISDWRPFEQCRENVERARRERKTDDAADVHERALRNGMPPSGRWA